MKKAYVAPTVEKVEFQYEIVVAQSNGVIDYNQAGYATDGYCKYNRDPSDGCSEK